jgi:hypothetical protein
MPTSLYKAVNMHEVLDFDPLTTKTKQTNKEMEGIFQARERASVKAPTVFKTVLKTDRHTDTQTHTH